MQFRKVLALRGPNIWANFPVLEAWVDLGALKDSPSDELPGFTDRLTAWLPSMIEHRCSVGRRGGFFERLRRGTYQAHILEHVALELQTLAGTEVGFGRTRESNEDGVYKVALEYEYEDLGRASLEVARELCLAAVYDRPFDVAGEIEKLKRLADSLRPSPATRAVLEAARARGIPARLLNKDGLVRLGWGVHQRRVLAGQTEQTAALAESIADDAELAQRLLQSVGVPVARPEELAASTPCWRLLLVGGNVVAAARLDGPESGNAAAAFDGPIHLEVIARAAEAARVIGLDVAAIDLAAADLGRPLEEQGGGVLAVRARLDPDRLAGAAPAVGHALVGHLYPSGATGRIPVAAVTGVNGKTTTVRLLAHIVGRVYRSVGMTCTEGIYVGGRRIDTGDCSGPKSAALVLNHPRVEAAVLETARGGILREGLGFDRCDVAVVTNIAEGDHLGLGDIDTPEKLARVKRTIVDVVAREGAAVLKADDPLVADMAAHCPGTVVFFARDGSHPLVVEHRAKGGRAAFVRDRHILLADGQQEIPLVPLGRVPLTHGGRVGFQVENALAAAAAAWSLGVPCEVIRVGLESFSPHLDQVPGRFNLLEFGGATVVIDYGHNPSSLACLVEALDQFPHPRRCAVYSTAGDRRDVDLVRQGQQLGDAFDRVILYEDHYTRGRRPGEIMALFRQGLAAGRRVRQVEEIQGSVKAIETALREAHPGELVLVQADEIDETVDFIQARLATGGAGREIEYDEALALSGPPGRPELVRSASPVA